MFYLFIHNYLEKNKLNINNTQNKQNKQNKKILELINCAINDSYFIFNKLINNIYIYEFNNEI